MLVMDAAKRSAGGLLARGWDGTFPVDPVALAEGLGIRVKSASFKDPNTSGAIIANSRDDVTIYFADEDDYARRIFTVAHELGHFSERFEANDQEFSFVEKRHSNHYDLHEFYADEFAGNLLMPTGQFKALWDTGMSISDIAKFFSVSAPAVRKRLDRLRKMHEIDS